MPEVPQTQIGVFRIPLAVKFSSILSVTCDCGRLAEYEVGPEKERKCVTCMLVATIGKVPVLVRKLSPWEDTP